MAVSQEQLAELKEALADCGCKENGYCEAWGCGVVADLIAEVERLKRGDFTEEEFQSLCHNFSEEDAARFRKGCEDYQRKLFGDCL